MHIRSVAVLGAGTMGAQIAAHFANAGVPALLLDVTADAAKQGLERARALKPDPFFTPDTWKLDHDRRLRRRPARASRDSDWIIEAVVEQLDVKRGAAREGRRRAAAGLDRQLEHVRHSDRRARRGAQRRLPAALARHALLQPAALPAPARGHSDAGDRPGGRRGRHATSPTIASARASSSRRTRRTSSATTSALYGVMRILATVAAGEYTIEEVDAITGPAARPAEERHVPHARSRRPRHPRPRRRQPARAAAATRAARRVDAAAVRRRRCSSAG